MVGAKQALRRLLQKQILLPFCGCSPPLTKRHTTVPTHRPDSSDSLGCQKRRMRVEVEVEGLRHLSVRRRFLSVAVVCRIALLRFASLAVLYCSGFSFGFSLLSSSSRRLHHPGSRAHINIHNRLHPQTDTCRSAGQDNKEKQITHHYYLLRRGLN